MAPICRLSAAGNYYPELCFPLPASRVCCLFGARARALAREAAQPKGRLECHRKADSLRVRDSELQQGLAQGSPALQTEPL